MNAPIRCEQLSKRYRKVAALHDLNLEIPEAAIYALVGPNGAGKTTLIKILANILQPTSGSAQVLGVDSRRLSPHDFTRIGYVSENQRLPEWMTVDYFFAYLKPFYPTWDENLATGLLRDLQLPGDRRLGQLSRGMKMKVALASSLAYHPRLILLDEPFSGLDPLARDEFIQGLLDRAGGTTILVSSHDLADLESFASHIGFMDAGRLHVSEESSALAARFREIEVTVVNPPDPVQDWPAHWSMPQTSPALVRFVDSAFDPDQTPAAISHFFPGASNVAISAMPLRDIFIALARRKGNFR